MTRQGYSAEYRCKKENAEIYGKISVIKVAIGGSSDYLIAHRGKLIKFIEVKETKKSVYYPSLRERNQFKELVRMGRHHRIPVEIWIYFKRGKGRPSIKHIGYIYNHDKPTAAPHLPSDTGQPMVDQVQSDELYTDFRNMRRDPKILKPFKPLKTPGPFKNPKVFKPYYEPETEKTSRKTDSTLGVQRKIF